MTHIKENNCRYSSTTEGRMKTHLLINSEQKPSQKLPKGQSIYKGFLTSYPPHNGRKSLILAPQEIPDISGYQWGFGCQFVKAYITENPVTNQKIL